MGNRLKNWAKEVRAPFLTASTMPILLGTAVAYSASGEFHLIFFVLTLIAGICAHIGANVVNDYFDYRSGTDNINVEYTRPFTGGSRMIQLGLMTPREVFAEALVFFAISGIIGIYLAFERGIFVLILGIIGIFSGFFYTAPPVNLAKRGIGELFIGLNFGVLMSLGAYYVQVQKLSWEPVWAAIPVGILIATVLYINEFPDYNADKAAGKRHLVVRLGKRRAAKGYAFLMISVYVWTTLAVVLGWISPFSLIAFLTLPLAITGIGFSKDFYHDSFRIIPANAATIQCHMMTGILLTVGYLLASLEAGLWVPFVLAVVVLGALNLIMSGKLEAAREAPPPTVTSRESG